MEKQKCGYLNPDKSCNCNLRCLVGIKPSKHELETKVIGKECPGYKSNYNNVFNKAVHEIKYATEILNKLAQEEC